MPDLNTTESKWIMLFTFDYAVVCRSNLSLRVNCVFCRVWLSWQSYWIIITVSRIIRPVFGPLILVVRYSLLCDVTKMGMPETGLVQNRPSYPTTVAWLPNCSNEITFKSRLMCVHVCVCLGTLSYPENSRHWLTFDGRAVCCRGKLIIYRANTKHSKFQISSRKPSQNAVL